MDDFLVEGNADMTGKFFVTEKRAAHSGFGHELAGGMVDIAGGHAGREQVGKLVENFRRGLTGPAHFLDIRTAFDRDHTAAPACMSS